MFTGADLRPDQHLDRDLGDLRMDSPEVNNSEMPPATVRKAATPWPVSQL